MKLNKANIFWYLLIAVLIVLNLSSCSIYKKRILDRYCILVHDTTIISKTDTFVLKKTDSVVITKGGVVETIYTNLCDSNGILKAFKQTFKNGGNTTTIESKGGVLVVKSDCQDQINFWKFESEKSKKELENYRSIQKVVEKPLHWFDKFKLSYVGTIFTLLGVLLVVLGLYYFAQWVRTIAQ